MAFLFVLSEHYRSADKSGVREYSGGRAASVSLRIFFCCAKSCDALHRGRLSTAKCLRSNHEFAAGPIFQKEMPSIWMAFLFV